jgi:hypothetical protein
MTPEELAAYVRFKTKTNSTVFTDADILTVANVVKNRLVDRALESDEDLFEVPTYMSLVANQREYPLISSLLSRINRVEALLDGTNWLKLDEFSLTEYKFPISSEALITERFSNEEGLAKFDIMRNAIWIYSGTITSVTDGLKIWLNTRPANIVSMAGTTDMSVDPSTTTHGIPAGLHNVLATGIIIEYKESQEKPIPLTEMEQNYKDDVEKALQNLKKANYDREIFASIPFNDGSQY